MDRVFEALFKYRPLLFQQGEVGFATPWPLAVLLLGAGAVAVAAVVTYGAAGGKASAGDRTVLATLRLSALGVLTFCLLQPTLVLTSTIAQRNFVGILVDDSRSMNLPGEDERPRSAFVTETFGAEGSELLDALSERFALRYFRFAGDAGRIPSVETLGFDGTRTDLPTALDRAREELSSVPLSGLVVLSDGADNGGRALAEALVPLQAASIPVFTVGLGAESLSPDVQLGPIDMPRTVLQGSALVVDVVVSHHGYGSRAVPLIVEDGSRRLAEDTVRLDGDEPTVARVRFTLEEPGPRRIRFRVPAQDGEAVVENNAREIGIEVRETREKILYFEGEPRYEVKFLRRAVSDDPNIQVVVLQRTAENKYLRLDVDDADELAGGFPQTREELFRYRGVILGSIEASFFTHDQLQMLADFVSQRGGGLLALGGRSAFAEGGYAGTALAEALPVHLEEPASEPRDAFTEVQVAPTVPGRTHPAVQLRTSAETSLASWDSLPPLSTLNRIVRAKPGATILLEGRTDDEDPRIVLAHHRYGRGKALAFPVQDAWMWQMHASVPVEDTKHETLWQQLLRWTVDGVPTPVELRAEHERIEVGEALRLTATVLDSTYVEVNDALVEATLVSAAGDTLRAPLAWTVEEDGVYAGEVRPGQEGEWSVSVAALRDGAALGSASLHVRVGPSDAEYFDAGRRTRVLERLATETGGRFYTPATVDRLPEDLTVTGAGVTLTEERDLWDMPILFLLLVGLIGAEWGYRRIRGLV